MTKQTHWIYSCLILLSSITTQFMNAQTYCGSSSCELVCNGGFETYTPTPTRIDQIEYATGWYNMNSILISTPDLYTTASSFTSGVQIPCNSAGYQAAHSGNAYAGLFHGFAGGNNWQYAEGIQTFLQSSMISGKMYDVNFYVSKSDLADYDYNNMRVDLGNTTYTISPSLTNDITNWVLVSFPHCADGSEYDLKIYCPQHLPETTCTYTPVAGCSYTVSRGSYVYIDDVSVKEVSFSVPSQTVCLNTAFTVTAVPTCSINTANYTYSWNYGDGSSAVNTGTNTLSTHSYSAYGTYTGSLTVGTGSCAVTYTYNIYVPALSVAITTNTNTICNSTTNFTATPSPSGSYTYSWVVTNAATGATLAIPGTGTTTATPALDFTGTYTNVNVCVIITNTLGCSTTQCLFMPSCCATPTNAVKYTSPTYSTTVGLPGTYVVFGGTVTINSGGHLIIGNKNITFDPNTKII